MASSTTPRLFARKAEADLTAKQFCFVKPGTAEGSMVAAVAGNKTVGILQDAPNTGEHGAVAVQGGGAKLKLGGTVAAGDYLKSDANGAGVVATVDKDEYGAKADVAGVSGDIIGVEVVQGQMGV